MTEQNDDFVSFEKALRDLKLQSEELKKLVSEGEIRAFRDGQSMKFRKEDVEALASPSLELDGLEDDTGMVTEELSEEDTLLVEDDLEEVEEVTAARVPQARSRREQLVTKREGEHPLVMAAIVLTGVALLWGAMLSWDIAGGASPGDGLLSALWKTDKAATASKN